MPFTQWSLWTSYVYLFFSDYIFLFLLFSSFLFLRLINIFSLYLLLHLNPHLLFFFLLMKIILFPFFFLYILCDILLLLTTMNHILMYMILHLSPLQFPLFSLHKLVFLIICYMEFDKISYLFLHPDLLPFSSFYYIQLLFFLYSDMFL